MINSIQLYRACLDSASAASALLLSDSCAGSIGRHRVKVHQTARERSGAATTTKSQAKRKTEKEISLHIITSAICAAKWILSFENVAREPWSVRASQTNSELAFECAIDSCAAARSLSSNSFLSLVDAALGSASLHFLSAIRNLSCCSPFPRTHRYGNNFTGCNSRNK